MMKYLMMASGLLLAGTLWGAQTQKVDSVIEVAQVWSGHPVGFALLTHGRQQFVAYYDANRQMTVAARQMPSTNWFYQKLPTSVGWDSHNYIALALDEKQCLHLSGNMHVKPLIYFKSSRPLDIASLQAVPEMIGNREKQCTYPRFIKGPQQELIFTYRDGRSGNGDQIFNVYNAAAGKWSRLLDQPLFAGNGRMNAYYHGPVKGPDGYFHVCWVWRDTPDCSSNHDLSYAKSQDLKRWVKSNGSPLQIPITLESAEIVDPVPPKGGIINVNHRLGFDSQKRPILTYHKYDAQGHLQAYGARLESGRWKLYQISDWNHRWEFSGGGSIVAEVHIGAAQLNENQQLTLAYSHIKHGSGVWVLDEKTLRPNGTVKRSSPLAAWDKKLAISHPGLKYNSASDAGSAEAGTEYQLRWQTLPANRDRPREVPLPPGTTLRLFKLVAAEE